MKVKELIAKLQKYDQDTDIILEHNIDEQDAEIGCYIPWDIINGDLPNLGLRNEEVNTFKEIDPYTGEEREMAYFEQGDNPIQTRKVIVLSSTQFKYGKGEDDA